MIQSIGAPEEIRTPDPQIRSLVLRRSTTFQIVSYQRDFLLIFNAMNSMEGSMGLQCVSHQAIMFVTRVVTRSHISMPKLGGYEAARIIREQPWGKRMFLVALSGWGHHLDQQRSKESGFDAHLTKPAKYEKLMEVLDLVASNEQAELLPDREL